MACLNCAPRCSTHSLRRPMCRNPTHYIVIQRVEICRLGSGHAQPLWLAGPRPIPGKPPECPEHGWQRSCCWRSAVWVHRARRAGLVHYWARIASLSMVAAFFWMRQAGSIGATEISCQ